MNEPFLQQLRESGKLVDLGHLQEYQISGLLERYTQLPGGSLPDLATLSYNNRNRLIRAVPEHPHLPAFRRLALLEELLVADLLCQQYTCEALARMEELALREIAPLLRRIAIASFPKARVFVAEVLTEFRSRGPADLRSLLLDWASDPEPDVREVVALVYRLSCQQGDYRHEDVQLLDQLSQDEFSSVRRQVAEALRFYLEKPWQETLTILVRLCHDNRWETAAAAIESVGYAGNSFTRQALRLLRSFLLSENKVLARRAALGLRRLALTHPRRILAAYRGIVQDRTWQDLDVLQTVLLSLRDLHARNPELAWELIRQLSRDSDQTLSSKASALLEELSGGMQSAGEG